MLFILYFYKTIIKDYCPYYIIYILLTQKIFVRILFDLDNILKFLKKNYILNNLQKNILLFPIRKK
jgi:hypothetical protein